MHIVLIDRVNRALFPMGAKTKCAKLKGRISEDFILYSYYKSTPFLRHILF